VKRQGPLQRLRSQRDRHAGWWAFAVHRVSGIALAFFLPVHFWALSRALEGDAALDGFLRWAQRPSVRFAEWALVVLLAAHLTGGLRILALEFLPWRDWQKSLAAVVAGVSLVVAVSFFLEIR
jgi:fumarate reductase subunit D